MADKTLIITSAFILVEIVFGTILAELYINQYDFWTSSQSLEQFIATLLLIYVVTTITFGTFNLIIIKRLEAKILIHCSLTAIVVGAFSAILFFITSDTLKDYFNIVHLSPALIVLLGLIIGFNFPILKRLRADRATPHNKSYRSVPGDV